MLSSPCPFVLDDFPCSPSSAWSFDTGLPSPNSVSQDHLSPPTPASYFSPVPASDEFADLRLKKPSVSPPATSTYHLSGEDMAKERVLLRNMGRQGNIYDRFESSPPRNIPCVPPVSPKDATHYFSWETTQPIIVNANERSDPLRYSLLLHEVSLLAGLAADDDNLPGDGGSLVLEGSDQVFGIQSHSLPPIKSLASRKHENTSPSRPTNSPSNNPISRHTINPHADLSSVRLPIGKQTSVESIDFAAPIHRHRTPNAVRPSPSPHRRQGQVFYFEPPLSDSLHRRAVDLDKAFTHPREPPPKPTPNPLPNRCSSLDRLEHSLRKLEAYAPRNRESQSEGRPSNHVVQRKDKCPSLPPPRRLKKQHLDDEHLHRSPSHPPHDYRPSGSFQPLSRPSSLHQNVAPRNRPPVLLYDEPCGENTSTPGSFMDMDIPRTEASHKLQVSFPRNKMKNLVIVARRLSRGAIAWGKNLAGSTKRSLEETTV